MYSKKMDQIRIIIVIFIGAIIAMAFSSKSYFLSIASIITGLLFMIFARSKVKSKNDEREISIQEKAANMTYAIFTPVLGISALLMLVPVYSGLSVFRSGEYLYIESLGMVFAYLVLFMISIYAICYHFFNRKYGGGSSEE